MSVPDRYAAIQAAVAVSVGRTIVNSAPRAMVTYIVDFCRVTLTAWVDRSAVVAGVMAVAIMLQLVGAVRVTLMVASFAVVFTGLMGGLLPMPVSMPVFAKCVLGHDQQGQKQQQSEEVFAISLGEASGGIVFSICAI